MGLLRPVGSLLTTVNLQDQPEDKPLTLIKKKKNPYLPLFLETSQHRPKTFIQGGKSLRPLRGKGHGQVGGSWRGPWGPCSGGQGAGGQEAAPENRKDQM